jgi:hypothetical protein
VKTQFQAFAFTRNWHCYNEEIEAEFARKPSAVPLSQIEMEWDPSAPVSLPLSQVEVVMRPDGAYGLGGERYAPALAPGGGPAGGKNSKKRRREEAMAAMAAKGYGGERERGGGGGGSGSAGWEASAVGWGRARVSARALWRPPGSSWGREAY